MSNGIKSVFESSKYSDLTISCHGEEFKEATTAKINLDDDDLATVKRMISYLYTLDYEDQDWANMEEIIRDGDSITIMSPEVEDTQNGQHEASAKFQIDLPHGQGDIEHENTLETQSSTDHVVPADQQDNLEHERAFETRSREADHFRMLSDISVYAIADKYDIPPLKLLARKKFETLALGTWPHHDFPTIVKAAFEWTSDNDQGLRSIVTKVCADNVGDLLLLKGPSALEMRNMPLLGFDLLSIIKKHGDEENERLSSINAAAEVKLHQKSEEARKLRRDRDLG